MIPPFDHNSVLPPIYNGAPSDQYAQSPFNCDIMEFCVRFSITPARCSILKGFLQFRLDCVANHIKGFQWIDGSFVEDIERIESRDPHDIDVATFCVLSDASEEARIMSGFPEFVDFKLSKVKYSVDHYPVVINQNPLLTVKQTKYWTMLFSHSRRGVWKGMLQIPLYDTDDRDKEALSYLNSL